MHIFLKHTDTLSVLKVSHECLDGNMSSHLVILLAWQYGARLLSTVLIEIELTRAQKFSCLLDEFQKELWYGVSFPVLL